MKPSESAPDISQIECEILVYLAEHPEAEDTLEGIVGWWLLERRIKRQTAKVKEALDKLVAKGLVLERKGRDSQVRYRTNQRRLGEIRALLKEGKGVKG